MTGGHLGAAVLAEYDEGLLPADQAAQVRAHLADCDPCSALHAQLGVLVGRLHAAPERLPVPDQVVARIDAALAAERPVPQTVVRLQPRRRMLRHMPQILGAAAAVGAIIFVGYVGINQPSGGDDSGATTSADAPESGTDEDAGADVALPEPLSDSAKASLDDQIRAVAGAEAPATASQSEDSEERDDAYTELSADCGHRLAEELGRDLLGSAAIDVGGVGNVLVVVTGAGQGSAQGWVLPNCDATTAEALADHTVRLD
jgi:hypothetical protein